jgi:chromosome segregation ATPase
MERLHVALDLSERDNERLRLEFSAIASRGLPLDATPEAAAAAAAAATAVTRGGMQDELLSRYEALQSEASQTEESLRLAKKSAASMEAYLGVLQSEASESNARNEAQQRRLETLTAENSKLKKETSKLRSEVTSSRMAAFEHELLGQELQGTKDAAAAMEAQLARLHAENASLREGGGLKDELAVAHEQLREALESKSQLQIAMASQVRRRRDAPAPGLPGSPDSLDLSP